MNNLDDKIKNSKNVIEESNINNANEIYETVKNKNKKHFNKEKINNFLNSINKKQLLKYSFITLLLITITIASMAIISVSTPKVIVKDKNNFTSGLTQTLSNKVQNAKSVGELKAIISNSLIYEEDTYKDYGGTATSPGEPLYPEIDTDHIYQTNIQVEGVDEGDIVKVNGNYIYYVTNAGVDNSTNQKVGENALHILKKVGDTLEKVKTITFPNEEKEVAKNEEAVVTEYTEYYPSELLFTDKYIILSVSISSRTKIKYDGKTSTSNYHTFEKLYIYDTNNYELVTKIAVPGDCVNARLIKNQLYVISNYYDYRRNNYEDILPQYGIDDTLYDADIDKIFYCPGMGAYVSSYIVIFRITLGTNIIVEDNYFLAPPMNNVYVNENAIYLINQYSNSIKTETDNTVTSYTSSRILAIDISGTIKFNDIIEVKGQINGRYWIDEYNGYLRVASTGTLYTYKLVDNKYKYGSTSSIFNHLTVFKKDKDGCYQEVSSITEGLGEEGERIQSARFNKNVATIVTFRQTDPLYYVDLKDPTNPKITSEIKVSGYSVYQHPYTDDYVIGIGYETNENGSNIGFKIALYDISDKTNIKAVGDPIIFYNADGYRSLQAMFYPNELFLDLSNNIFGFNMDFYNRETDKSYYEYSEKFYLFKIDLNSDQPLSIFFNKQSDIHNKGYSYPEFARMIFIKDKYYLLSHDKVIIYELTNKGLVLLEEYPLY